MADDIIARLRCSYADPPCKQCAFCAARAEIERLRAREQDLRMHAEQDACEIERLRAAGDALAEALRGWCDGMDAFEEDQDRVRAWHEARRG